MLQPFASLRYPPGFPESRKSSSASDFHNAAAPAQSDIFLAVAAARRAPTRPLRVVPSARPAPVLRSEIQRDTPQEGRKFPRWLVSLSFFKQPKKRILLQILSAMRIADHARAQTPDRLFPTLHQARELRMVVVPLYTAHRFLISSRAQQRKCRKNRALHARSSGLTFHK
jgi:hypothetical protein